MGDKRNGYRVLVGKQEGKRSLGRRKRRWEDNIKMDLRDRIRWYGLDSSGSGHRLVEALMDATMNLRVP
jgi:hypothetical protein